MGAVGNGEGGIGLEVCGDPLAGDLAGTEYLVGVLVDGPAGKVGTALLVGEDCQLG